MLERPRNQTGGGVASRPGYHFGAISQVSHFKVGAAEFYTETRRLIVERIVQGSLVHVDETKANIRGKTACVWVFTNLHEVAYLYSDSRDSEMDQTTLAAFKGVLVSGFYSGYDSLACPQQKCLLHLVRDLNAERRRVMLRAWLGTREISPRRSRVRII